ncbi:Urea-proton symporter DUR3 [Nymphon striatum]|nr:Urea-proton symporter DUR3 [Nymphon striatum]
MKGLLISFSFLFLCLAETGSLETEYDRGSQIYKDTPECRSAVSKAREKAKIRLSGNETSKRYALRPTIEVWEAVILMSGTGIFATLLAQLFNYLHQEFSAGRGDLDTAFDAGGRVSVGLTATTIVSQWTWAATLLQSCTVASQEHSTLGFVKRNLYSCSEQTKHAAYVTIVRPHLEYASAVWDPYRQDQINSIEAVQRRAFGISGPLWYASGATVQILLFAMLSVQLKIKSPGAKTFLQLVRARFGKKTHITYCAFALLTNVIITAMLMLGGSAVMVSLIKSFSVPYAVMIMVVVMGTYTWIGGLGATFYVSYFNTSLIFIIMIIFALKIYHDTSTLGGAIGSVSGLYDIISCAVGPEDNKDRSLLTIVSQSGVTFGVINLVGNFGTVFVDQSYWQSSVAAKPKDGVWGFLAGGLTWFSVPFMFATTMGLTYIALSIIHGEPLLTPNEVEQGLVPAAVADKIMGKAGTILMLLMILVAVTSTGSAEVIAVTSLLVYDVYQIYLKPFRSTTDSNSCILCGKGRGRMANPRDKCVCESMTFCKQCHADNRKLTIQHSRISRKSRKSSYFVLSDILSALEDSTEEDLLQFQLVKEAQTGTELLPDSFYEIRFKIAHDLRNSRDESKRAVKPDYKCKTHGDYRRYYDLLGGLKDWCMLWTTLLIIPLTGLLEVSGIKLGWMYQFMGIVIGSAVVPIALATCWSRLTGVAMIAGGIGGAAMALTTWLALASTYQGGLYPKYFFINTGQQKSMFWGNIVAICSGGIITVVTSFITNRQMDVYHVSEIWENTRDIDNPLFPWTELYARELNISGANKLDNRPSLDDVERCFQSAKWVAYIGALVLTLGLIVLWPASMVAAGVLQENGFTHWVNIAEAWGWMAAIFIIIIPVVNEVQSMLKEKRELKRVGDVSIETDKTNELYGRKNSNNHPTENKKERPKKRNVSVINIETAVKDLDDRSPSEINVTQVSINTNGGPSKGSIP